MGLFQDLARGERKVQGRFENTETGVDEREWQVLLGCSDVPLPDGYDVWAWLCLSMSHRLGLSLTWAWLRLSRRRGFTWACLHLSRRWGSTFWARLPFWARLTFWARLIILSLAPCFGHANTLSFSLFWPIYKTNWSWLPDLTALADAPKNHLQYASRIFGDNVAPQETQQDLSHVQGYGVHTSLYGDCSHGQSESSVDDVLWDPLEEEHRRDNNFHLAQ